MHGANPLVDGHDEPSSHAPAGHSPLAAPPTRLAHVPRLSIRYLLIWTAVTAVLLQCGRALELFDSDLGWVTILAALFAAAAGLQLFGALLIGWHTVRRSRWPLEPGEWLVLALTNLLAVWLVIVVLDQWRIGPPFSVHYGSLLPYLMMPAALGVALMLGAIALRHRPLWSLLLVVPGACLFWYSSNVAEFFFFPPVYYSSSRYWIIGLLERIVPGEVAGVFLLAAVALRRRFLWCAALVVPGLGVLSSYLLILRFLNPGNTDERVLVACAYAILVGTLSLIIAAVIADRRQRQPRHWLHWSGVLSSVFLLLGLLTLLTLAILINL
jgi:hypothetical protein